MVPLMLTSMGGSQTLPSRLVGAVLAIADGLVVAELGTAPLGSGGSYLFLRDSFGRERWGS